MKEELTKTLNAKERRRFSACNEQIKTGLRSCFDTGAALAEVRDDKLYREDYGTFEDYCREMFQVTRAHAYRLIEAADLKGDLSPIGDKITNEAQARELAKVPEGRREEVLKQVSTNGPITAKAIAEQAKSFSEKPVPIARNVTTTVVIDQKQNGSKNGKDEQPNLDKTEYPIPSSIQELWDRAATEFGALCAKVSVVRSEVRKVMEAADEDDPIWRRTSANSIMLALDNAYRELNAGIPFAVCPYCQGRGFKNCTACCHRGYIGKFEWTTAIPKELIAIREKGGKK